MIMIMLITENIRIILSRSDFSVKLKDATNGSIQIYNSFNYLAAPRPILGHYRDNGLTHPILITSFLPVRPEGHRDPLNEVGFLGPGERLVTFEPGAFLF